MKKIVICRFVFIIALSSRAISYAYTPDAQMKESLENIILKIEMLIEEQWSYMRIPIIELLEKYELKVQWNERARYIISYLIEKVEQWPRLLTVSDFPKQYENISIVQLPGQIVAVVNNIWTLGQQNDDAFGYLAWFIFGDNSNANEIAMTSPVIREKLSENSYETAFIMPKWRTLETLPKPTNDRVTIKKIPWSLQAVWRFSWLVSEKIVDEQRALFINELENEGIIWYGLPTLAQYSWPRVRPSSRRNELWVSLNP